MVFSSAVFLFCFLPVVFLAYRLLPGPRAKNGLLILGSLVFYAFGGLGCLPVLLGSVLVNYLAGLLAARRGRLGRAAVAAAAVLDLGLLGTFKYLNFITANLALIPGLPVAVTQVALPIGISFFIFQGLSYVIDVYREPALLARSFWRVLLYITFFPQLVAGPIVKYGDVAGQLARRETCPADTAAGLCRFITGLSKKLLLADTLGRMVDAVYALPAGQLDLRLGWLAALCYTLEIYFDFSGYSDMAIGLGRLFGFHFLENFDHPYCAGSIREFWRRWHISLSAWFRDYVYIPLGGNRRGLGRARLNRLLVFLLTGLWHGANWTFVLWGAWHGLLMLAEDLLPRPRHRLGKALGHVFTLLAVTLGFVLFRANSLAGAAAMLGAMFTGFTFTPAGNALLASLLSLGNLAALALALPLCLPVGNWLAKRRLGAALQALRLPAALVLFALCLLSLAANGFNPFIYFQF